jgi:hypothetical protein
LNTGVRRLILFAASTAVLSACSKPAPAPPLQPSQSKQTPDPVPAPTDADTAAVKQAYADFWPLLATFDRHVPENEWRTVLGRSMADPQLSQAIAIAQQQHRTGITVYGRPVPRAPRVTLRPPDGATIRDCADLSDYGEADATGGHRTAGESRTPVTLSLVRGADRVWRVSKVDFPGGAC